MKDILRDYEEIQAKQSAEFSAAGTSFPGGLAAFLRQLALLDREKRADLAEVMTARELEDYEIRETAAGRHMREMLEGTAATDDQRRSVFRAEQAFNDQFGFTFDLSPAALREREAARQTMETKIYRALGGTMFAAWLQREDASYSEFVPLALRQGRPADFTLVELWEVRNNFMQSKFAIAAQPDDAVEQRQAAALQAAQARIAALIGVAEAADPGVRRWLQQTPSAVPPAK